MYNSLIAASLFQNKTCMLPGIGTLSVRTDSAASDFVNTQILAPMHRIQFSPAEEGDMTYNEFSAISQLLKKDFEQNGKIELDGIGILEKDASDKFIFIPVTLDSKFYKPVNAERVIRENTEHAILVGDKETTNVVMTEYFTETVVKKDKWWIWAAVLSLIAIAAIVYHLSQYGYTIGNNHVLGAAG